jgi:ATP-dependent DNA helicase RecG
MRPAVLAPLFAPVTALPGIGPKLSHRLARLIGGVPRPVCVLDLLFHLPRGGVDRRWRATINEADGAAPATISVVVRAHRAPPRRFPRSPYRVRVEDETGALELVFFNAAATWLEARLPVGTTRWVCGQVERKDGIAQMVHPDRILTAAEFATLPGIEPIYGLSEGLSQRQLGRAAAAALKRLPSLPEWHTPAFIAGHQLPGFGEALRRLHTPDNPDDLAPSSRCRARLAADELLANQLALALFGSRMRASGGRTTSGDPGLAKRLERVLPFALTPSQLQALAEIRGDLAKPTKMLRLLHGDVGSGKTVVALLAMASVVAAGRQAALMAPTEMLARQHYQRVLPWCQAVGLNLTLLTGGDRPGQRSATRAGLAEGEMDIAVGTHALLATTVTFRDLALAIVDEQHRFGVHQRLALGNKGTAVDVLVMTATPIPRTLVLSAFGDMDISTLADQPVGRAAVATRAMPLARLADVYAAVARKLGAGAQVYWICPLIADSDAPDLAAVNTRYADLRTRLGERVALVHGKMPSSQREAEMARFAGGEALILVATTVIEVGIDVPGASLIVIEGAERFGLAQLHQLRGRVGRGATPSTCLLLYRPRLSPVAEARLNILRETTDGFRIAEADLTLRGEGELFGTRQSGMPPWRLCSPELQARWLPLVHEEARLIVRDDPELRSPRGDALRYLLYLFERDDAVRLLVAG